VFALVRNSHSLFVCPRSISLRFSFAVFLVIRPHYLTNTEPHFLRGCSCCLSVEFCSTGFYAFSHDFCSTALRVFDESFVVARVVVGEFCSTGFAFSVNLAVLVSTRFR
jgi:hypothetical protein